MNKLFNHIQKIIKKNAILWFLKRRRIIFSGIPKFFGHWPQIHNSGTIILGKECSFRSFRLPQQITILINAKLEVGDNSFLNDGINICAAQSIKIGHHTKIADMTYIYDTDFHEVSPDVPVKHAPVYIGNNVWIGAKSIILPGAFIGDHSVIAAGSVVNGRIPAKCLAAGTPAKVIKTLNIPDDWLRN